MKEVDNLTPLYFIEIPSFKLLQRFFFNYSVTEKPSDKIFLKYQLKFN